MRAWATALLVAALLAGCARGPDPVEPARSAAQEADRHAREWHSDAVLVLVQGIELRNGTELVFAANGTDEAWNATYGHDDDAPGDGRAPAWVYVYHSRFANLTRAFVLDADGNLLAARDDTRTGAPVGDWQLDSAEAWARARAANATLRQVLDGGEVHVARSMLRALDVPANATPWRFEIHPHWFLAASADLQAEGIILVVDATNGTVYDLPGWSEAISAVFTIPVREMGSEVGILDATRRTDRHTFKVEEPNHGALAVAFDQYATSPPGQSMGLVLRDPDGIVVLTLNHTKEATPWRATVHGVVVDPAPGTYTLELSLPDGTTDLVGHYLTSWCTDGISASPYEEDACDHLPEP